MYVLPPWRTVSHLMLDVAGYRSRVGPPKDWGLWGPPTLHTDLLILRPKSSLQHYLDSLKLNLLTCI